MFSSAAPSSRPIDVAICTHNPNPELLQRVLDHLSQQTLPTEHWWIRIIDNASQPAITDLDLQWPANASSVVEPQLGLTYARLRAARETQAELVVFVDDDNLLAPDYLALAWKHFRDNPRLGAAGGITRPDYGAAPSGWFDTTLAPLGLRDFGPAILCTHWEPGQDRQYPAFAPIGAGLCIRRQALQDWATRTQQDHDALEFGRRGQQLTSGEDNDLVLTLLDQGWAIAYLPDLSLAHHIPARRLQPDYLSRLNYAASRDWVRVLDRHGIRPWPAIAPVTLPLRQFRAALRTQAWRSPAHLIRWRGACGQLAGQATLVRPDSEPGQSLGQRLQLGRLLYRLYHQPRRQWQTLTRQGWRRSLRDARDRGAMRQAARRLPAYPRAQADSVALHLLTGDRFWEQTAFCLHSLLRQLTVPVPVVIHDDGSLRPWQARLLAERIPNLQLISAAETEEQLTRLLPWDRYPCLRERRREYPQLRKLTDIHLGHQGWALVLDSDMLFWQHPTELEDWIQAPNMACCIPDIQTSYGHSFELMTELCGAAIPERVNVGLLGLNSNNLDWEELEHWCRVLIEREGKSYYQEQALSAMLLARQPHQCWSAERYRVLPDDAEILYPTAVLHHYVAEAKRLYFSHAWRHYLALPAPAGPVSAPIGRSSRS